MITKFTTTKLYKSVAISGLLALACILFLNLSLAKSQTVFWTETFNNGCTDSCLASAYTGPNGAWTIDSIGTNTALSNLWYISAEECGSGAGQCGSVCTATASLHIGANDGFVTDPGAAYDAGTGLNAFNTTSNWLAESPAINCAGKSGISIKFNYMMLGQAGVDFGSLAYYDGTSWSYYNGTNWVATNSSLPITDSTTCSGQGLWTSYIANLPASANNNGAIKIGFRWTNNNDGVGSDPSIAVDSVRLSYQIATGIEGSEIFNSIKLFPNPSSSEINISFIQQGNSSIKINIINPEGQIVYSEQNALFKGNYNKNINLESFAKGIYFLQIISDKETLNKKIIIE
jgi:hypothetical protein